MVRAPIAACVVAIAALNACLGYGSCARNRQAIATADEIASRFPPRSIVFVQGESWARLEFEERLLLHTYLYRYHLVSLTADEAEASVKFEFHRLAPLSPNWVVSDDRVVTSGGLVCSALVRNSLDATAGLPRVRR